MTEQHLFVYGTLKQGFRHHSVLREQVRCGAVLSATRGHLFDCGSWPALVADSDGVAIHGELYRVTPACLRRCDEIEGVADGLYERRLIALAATGPLASPIAQAWSYFYLQSTDGMPVCGSKWTG